MPALSEAWGLDPGWLGRGTVPEGGWSRAVATSGRTGVGGTGGPSVELFPQGVRWVAAHLDGEGQVAALGEATAL